jgi:integrase
MARAIHRLSTVAVRNAKPGMHADGGGLYLQTTEAADHTVSKSWLFRFTTGRTVTSQSGKQRREERQMGLGSLADVSLAEAREHAAACRQLRKQGIDPIESRRAAKAERLVAAAKAMTFDQAAAAYIASHRAGWRNPKHAAQWKATLATYVSPVFGSLPVSSIDTGLVLKTLEAIWATKPETAGRVRGRIEAVLDWTTARGYRTGENPARWRGHLDKLLPARSKVRKVRHHPALAYAELPAFLAALREQQGAGARALEFTILTVARTNETVGARWSEFDLLGKVWTAPAEHMKAGREHRVPLSAAAVAVLRRMEAVREGEQVFPGDRRTALSNMAMLMLLRRMGRDDLTVHGFRSTFRTWAAECTSFPREVIEAALAHLVGDATEQAYQRGDLFEKRRRLMAAWADYCARAPAAGVVVTSGFVARARKC